MRKKEEWNGMQVVGTKHGKSQKCSCKVAEITQSQYAGSCRVAVKSEEVPGASLRGKL